MEVTSIPVPDSHIGGYKANIHNQKSMVVRTSFTPQGTQQRCFLQKNQYCANNKIEITFRCTSFIKIYIYISVLANKNT